MDIEKARKRMADHIDGQAKWQGSLVKVRFVREDPSTSHQTFSLSKAPKPLRSD